MRSLLAMTLFARDSVITSYSIHYTKLYDSLARDVYDYVTDEPIHFTRFNEISAQYTFETTPVVLLDEAQMYSAPLMEKIRLISDTRQIKFIISYNFV